MSKNLVYATKRYPGRHSHERPGGRVLLVVVVATVVGVLVITAAAGVSPLDYFWHIVGLLVVGTYGIYRKARNVMAHRLVSSMLQKWGDGYYIYEFPPEWPVREILAGIVLRLKRRGYRVHRIEVPVDIDVPELGFERVVDAFRVEPGGKELYVLNTRSWNPRIRTGGPLSSWGPAQRVNAFLIRPVEKEMFVEEYDVLVQVTGNVLWDHDVDRTRAGHPTSIPREYWE